MTDHTDTPHAYELAAPDGFKMLNYESIELKGHRNIPLYTRPHQWISLTKEDIMSLFKVYPADPGFYILCDQVKMIDDMLKEKNCGK